MCSASSVPQQLTGRKNDRSTRIRSRDLPYSFELGDQFAYKCLKRFAPRLALVPDAGNRDDRSIPVDWTPMCGCASFSVLMQIHVDEELGRMNVSFLVCYVSLCLCLAGCCGLITFSMFSYSMNRLRYRCDDQTKNISFFFRFVARSV